MKFHDLPVYKKLMVGFGAVLAVVTLNSAATSWQAREASNLVRIADAAGDAQHAIDQGRGDLEAARASVRKMTLTGASQDLSRAQANLEALKQHIEHARTVLSKEQPVLVVDLAEFQGKVDAYVKNALQPEMDLSRDPATRSKAVEMVTSSTSAPLSAAADEALGRIAERVRAWSDDLTTTSYNALSQIETAATVSGAFSLLIGCAMAWLIGRAIGRPLNIMTDAMGRLAAGDHAITVSGLERRDEVGEIGRAIQVFKEAAIEKLRLEGATAEARLLADETRARSETERTETARLQGNVVKVLAEGLDRLAEGVLVHRIDAPFTHEYEKLRSDFNAAMEKLQGAMQSVATNTHAIRSGACEIATASDDLARRTEQQAASLEETAAALDEITATVKKTSEGAMHAKEIVSKAKADAERSGEIVKRAVSAMGAIETSSHKVSQIIGVIDEIAFQTNLLALNAGVEAARAGEAGRGFAVVASEVRGLAQRSAEAAKEIKGLISESERQVNEGVGLVGETGNALGRIVVQVGEIDTIVADISTSTREQATALQEVNTAVNQMDQVTQQNAAMVEQSTAASHSLTGEAEELSREVGRFQVGRLDGHAQAGQRIKAPHRGHAAAIALKPVGRGGAAYKAQAAAEESSWEEF